MGTNVNNVEQFSYLVDTCIRTNSGWFVCTCRHFGMVTAHMECTSIHNSFPCIQLHNYICNEKKVHLLTFIHHWNAINWTQMWRRLVVSIIQSFICVNRKWFLAKWNQIEMEIWTHEKWNKFNKVHISIEFWMYHVLMVLFIKCSWIQKVIVELIR